MMPQPRGPARGALRLSDNRAMPLARLHDPIVAIATAPGRGAVGIVRASGPDLKPWPRPCWARCRPRAMRCTAPSARPMAP
jgi:hypothetical protein